MSNVDANRGLMPSLLDRLTDPESGGTEFRRGYDLKQALDAVRRDVEDILNTRRSMVADPEEFAELKTSMITYGLPDFGSMRTSSFEDHRRLGKYIESLIGRFEPRLKNIRAVLVEDGDVNKQFNLKFQIHAKLRVEPSPEVAFETVVELMTGHAAVKKR